MLDIWTKLSKNQKIAVLAITVPAALTIAGGFIKYYWPNNKNTEAPTRPASIQHQKIEKISEHGTALQAESIGQVNINQTDPSLRQEFDQLKQRVIVLEKALIAKVPPVKTSDDAQKPLSSEEKAEYDKLITELEQKIHQAQEKFKQDLKISIDAQLSRAAILLRSTKYKEAEGAYHAILAAHPHNTDAIRGLGITSYELAKYEETEKLFRDILAKNEDSFGSDHPNVAFDLNNLAGLLRATNRLSEAEPLMRRVVKILENPGGESLPNYSGALNNLAGLLQATNRLSEAEPLMRRALKIFEDSLGPDHPNVATNLNNLAQLLQDTNHLSDAEPMMRRALKIDEASFGPDHPKVAIRLNNLAELLRATDRFSEVEPMMRRALKIFEDSLGPDHPNTQTVRNKLKNLK